jgi:polyisoprenoid-binding protein YceI
MGRIRGSYRPSRLAASCQFRYRIGRWHEAAATKEEEPMHRSARRIATWTTAALLAASPAAASVWELDPSHSAAQFSVTHMMVTTVRGQFSNVKGTVEIDDANSANVKVDATIDATTVDTREAKRDQHLKSADFFDVAKYPAITFKSKSSQKVGDGAYKVTGDLMIHGVTKEVVLDVTGAREVKDPWGHTRMGGVATTKVNRKDFGLNWNKTLETGGVLVSDDVLITIDLELTKKVPEAPEAPKK